jgi:CheY-like chemotaxis protein
MPTILVVDDVSANRDVLVTLLGHEGHTLIEAADGDEGLRATRTEHPDLVITDVLMPPTVWRTRRRTDPSAAGVQPQTDHRADAVRSESGHGRDADHARPADSG